MVVFFLHKVPKENEIEQRGLRVCQADGCRVGVCRAEFGSGLFWAVTEGVTGRRWGDGIKDSIPFSGILTTSRL